MSLFIPSQLSTANATLGGTILALLLLRAYWTARKPVPPGPRPLPLIGSTYTLQNLWRSSYILDMPQSEFALTWTKFGEQYGPMTWLAIPGQPFLILNSLEAAKELLGVRGSIYTDRPRFVMATDLMGEAVSQVGKSFDTVLTKFRRAGFQSLTPLSRFNSEWRSQRTLLKHALSVEVIKRDYSGLIWKKVQEYLEGLLSRPEDFLGDLNR
ncbi:hypothetical protein FRC01_012913 [Tulasnella sp. 417]|nr:hypothetical protein FRC01_012913 [Tulasnella sp. 417]